MRGYPDGLTEKSFNLFNHVLNAHQIWNHRINGEGQPYGVWEVHEADMLKKIDEDNYRNTLRILDTFDLEGNIHYTNSRGLTFDNSIRDILFHVVNHSTYHRGQIASEFKVSGKEPLATDYIFYKR